MQSDTKKKAKKGKKKSGKNSKGLKVNTENQDGTERPSVVGTSIVNSGHRVDGAKSPYNDETMSPFKKGSKHPLASQLRQPIKEPAADNDYINMSSINMFSKLHPNRKINQLILSKYNQDYNDRQDAKKNPQIYKAMALRQMEDQASATLPQIGNATFKTNLSIPNISRAQNKFQPSGLKSSEPIDPTKLVQQQLNQKTIYSSFMDGQLTEGKSRIDNFSQGESFFTAVNDTTMFNSTRTPKYYPKVDKRIKTLSGSPYVNRVSLISLAPIPKPPTPMREILEADVNQHHSDSSDDDYNHDEHFKSATTRITQGAIDGLSDAKIEGINRAILLNKYERGLKEWSKHKLTPRQLYDQLAAGPKVTTTRQGLHYDTSSHSPSDIKAKAGQMNLGFQQTFHVTTSPKNFLSIPSDSQFSKFGGSNFVRNTSTRNVSNFSQMSKETTRSGFAKFASTTTRKKLIQENLPQSRKELELHSENLHAERPVSREEWRRTGLPQVNKFYQNLNSISRLQERNIHKQKASVAYMAEATKHLVVPSTMGVVAHQGKDRVFDLSHASAGDNQAKAIGRAVELTNATSLRINNNRLTSKGALQILENISTNLTEINLSGNVLHDYEKARELRLKSTYMSNMKEKPPVVRMHTLQDLLGRSSMSFGIEPAKPYPYMGTDPILEELNEELEEDQTTASECVQKIVSYIAAHEKYNIQAWVLNKCRLTDTEVSLIGSALIKHRSSRLRKLYLNENDLGNAAALKLAEVLADPGLELKELGLKWNRITAIGGNAIAAALDTNVELKILDLSWNSIGVRPPENKKMRGSNIGPGEVGIAWGTALSNNQSLVHLDLSFNKIDLEDTTALSQQIVWNHTLAGLHYAGNMGRFDVLLGKIDSLGFIRMVDASLINPRDPHLAKVLPDGTHEPKYPLRKERLRPGAIAESEWTQGTFKDMASDGEENEEADDSFKEKTFLQLNIKSENCWICDSWVECEFNLDLVQAHKTAFGRELRISENLEVLYQVYVHFDFDEYQPDRMDDLRTLNMQDAGKFKLHRMVPQGRFHYFFTFQDECFFDDQQPKVPLGPRVRTKILVKLKQECRHAINVGKVELKFLNTINTFPRANELAIEDHKKKIEEETRDSESEEEVGLVGNNAQISGGVDVRTNSQLLEPEASVGLNTIQRQPFLVTGLGNLNSASHESLGVTINQQMFAEGSRTAIGDGQSFHLGSLESIQSISQIPTMPNRRPRIRGILGERPQYSILDSKTYKLRLKNCEIRPDKTLGARKEREKTPWSVELGLFSPYLKEEKKDLAMKCFEFDWSTMKQPRYKFSEEEEVKEEMRKVYVQIKELYREQAGYSPAGNVFSVGQTQLTIFLNEVLNCLDKEEGLRLRAADQGRIVAAVTSKRQVELPVQFNPPSNLIRCQFLEMMVRSSIEKYQMSGKADTELESVKKFNEEYLVKSVPMTQAQWRRKHTFTERVDIVMRTYLKHLEHIYGRFSGAHTEPGSKARFMEVDEFDNFCQVSGLINDSFVAREVTLVFNLSMFTQVDEINKGRHLRAVTIEFLEMVARAADEASFAPPLLNEETGEIEENMFVAMTLEQRQAQPMHVKLLNILPIVIRNCCEKKFLQKAGPVKVDFGPMGV